MVLGDGRLDVFYIFLRAESACEAAESPRSINAWLKTQESQHFTRCARRDKWFRRSPLLSC